MQTNSRAEAFNSAYGGSSRPSYNQSSSFGWQQQRRRPHDQRNPKQGSNRSSEPREIVLPTHSASRTEPVVSPPAPSKPPPPPNKRLDFLSKETPSAESPVKKKKFVAKPERSQWERGYRPGWMLSDNKAPPEKFEDGMKMYETYMKTGEVVYPQRSGKTDAVKVTATSYMSKLHNSKAMKKK